MLSHSSIPIHKSFINRNYDTIIMQTCYVPRGLFLLILLIQHIWVDVPFTEFIELWKHSFDLEYRWEYIILLGMGGIREDGLLKGL